MKRKTIVTTIFVIGLTLHTALAEVVSTNWDGLYLFNEIAKTNFSIKENILLTMTVSNGVDSERSFSWKSGTRCRTAFGWLIIRELPSGREVECSLPESERHDYVSSALSPLKPHSAQVFENDLSQDYIFTNGLYSIQIAGRFHFVDTSKGRFSLTSPPVYVCITNSVELKSTK